MNLYITQICQKYSKLWGLFFQGQLQCLQLICWCSHNLNTHFPFWWEGSPHSFHPHLFTPTWNILVTSKSKPEFDREPQGKLACDPVLICCLRQFLCCNNVLSHADIGNLTTDAKAKKKCNTPTKRYEASIEGQQVYKSLEGHSSRTKTF